MLQIKKMTETELNQVAAIEAEIFTSPWSKQGFEETLPMDNVCFLVAAEEQEVLGYCGLYMAADEGEITNVAVKPEYRRRGVADLILTEILKLGEANKISQFYLEVRVSNEAAIRLYEKHGFKKQGIRKNFYQNPREDAYVMSRKQAEEYKTES